MPENGADSKLVVRRLSHDIEIYALMLNGEISIARGFQTMGNSSDIPATCFMDMV